MNVPGALPTGRPQSTWHQLPFGARVYVVAIVAAGAALLVASVQRGAFARPALLLFLIVASASVSAIKIDLPVGWSHSTLSIGYAVSYVSLLVLGPGATSWVTMAGGLAQCRIVPKSRTPTEWFRTLFSMACLALSMEPAAHVLAWMSARGFWTIANIYVGAIVASALTSFFVNSMLVAAVVALSTRQSLVRVWDQDFLWCAPNYLIGALAAAVAVHGFRQWGYSTIALLALPMFLTYRLYKVYLGRMEDERRHVREVSEMHMATVEALALAIEAKDATAKSHVQMVQHYATALAQTIGLSDDVIQGIRTAALLHDVGKLGVPDHILSKPGPLTDDEFDKVRLHPEIGAGIVEAVRFPYPVPPLIRSHHERWDGKGFPSRLKGDEIPIGARVIAIADRFDTLRRQRPYRNALSRDQAVEQIHREAGQGLDPNLVARFIEILPALERELATVPESAPTPSAQPVSRGAGQRHVGRRDVFEDISRARQEFVALYEVAESMGTGLGVRDSMALIAEKLSRLVPFSACALFIAERGEIECRFASGVDADVLQRISMPRTEGLVGWTLQTGRPLVNGDPAIDLRAAKLDPSQVRWRTTLICPLKFEEMQAAIAVYHEQADFYGDNDARLLERTSKQAAAVVYNARLFDRAQADSVTDALTELPNRRFLAAHVAGEITRSRRSGNSFALLMIDLNGFKPINDRYGHAMGDAALKSVALGLKRCLRSYDVCCRYAGDEFVVLLEGCVRASAEHKGKELQRAVESVLLEAPDGTRISLGCSIGIAMFPEDAASYEALLAAADSRMYSQKMRRRAPAALAR